MDDHEYEINFGAEAQKAFDALTENEDWSYAGLVEALFRRYGKNDMEEIQYILNAAMVEAQNAKAN